MAQFNFVPMKMSTLDKIEYIFLVGFDLFYFALFLFMASEWCGLCMCRNAVSLELYIEMGSFTHPDMPIFLPCYSEQDS